MAQFIIKQLSDASALHHLMLRLAQETENMMFEVEEVPSEARLSKELVRLENPQQGTVFGAYDQEELVGFISLERGKLRRNHGSGTLVMGVRRDWSGRGIGYTLMSHAICWGRDRGMYRLAFDVRTENVRAVKLYLRLGFEIEGTIRRGAFIDGKLVDKYLMAILL